MPESTSAPPPTSVPNQNHSPPSPDVTARTDSAMPAATYSRPSPSVSQNLRRGRSMDQRRAGDGPLPRDPDQCRSVHPADAEPVAQPGAHPEDLGVLVVADVRGQDGDLVVVEQP